MSRIWKISHGFNNIDGEASDWLDAHKYVSVHVDTLKNQARNFRAELNIGDYVCLSRSSGIVALVRIIGEVVKDSDSPLSEDWMLRRYENTLRLPVPKTYSKKFKRGWTPNYNSTIFLVDESDNGEFEKEILLPYFGLTLALLDNNLQSTNLNVDSDMDTKKSSLNSILFGPPGTGKTFNTINYALSILEPDLDVNKLERKTLKEKYDSYCKVGRIRFVTFHQSFSYEDFVEGLKAKAVDGQLSYYVEKGVFTQICIDASNHILDLNEGNNNGKLDVDGSLLKSLTSFREELSRVGSVELTTKTNIPFTITLKEKSNSGVNITTSSGTTYPVDIKAVNNAYKNAENDHYSYLLPMFEYMRQHHALPGLHLGDAGEYVLIIDEINRGNISSIFGELITLIEPSKRAGEQEALTVTLPYSKKSFSVPNNLHIIGTMNTADRSLALMDTALRRRFDFIEMMPNLKVLEGVNVNGIDIPKMLEKMNQRIEVLYDREHTLGHAFFIPLKEVTEGECFDVLQGIFKNKILPLLEEYFFEDWEKIRLVLGDNQKKEEDEHLAFISRTENLSIDKLFGNNDEAGDLGLDEVITYHRNDSALGKVQSYTAIYEN